MRILTGIIVSFCASFVSFTALSQDEYAELNNIDVIMNQKIHELKKGALLVALHTKENSIQALQKRGRSAEAQSIADDQKAFNRYVVDAFRSNFTFCPVYFFYSNDIEKLKDKKLNEIAFLNDSLTPDPSIKYNGKFLTAEFSYVEQDTTHYLDGTNMSPRKYSGSNSYYGSANLGFPALLIKSEQFVQLQRPFPYYTRSYTTSPDKVKINRTVLRMNEKLQYYFETGKEAYF